MQIPFGRRLISDNMTTARYPAYITSAEWLGESGIGYIIDLTTLMIIDYLF